jgi:putative sigma-54 modulation protein
MQLQVKGKNLEVSESIRTYAEKKLGKLSKQLHELTRVEVELAVEKNPSIAANQVAEATVWLKGHTLRAREATQDMKASIDELTEKLMRQIKAERAKRRRHRGPDKRLDDGMPAPAGGEPEVEPELEPELELETER